MIVKFLLLIHKWLHKQPKPLPANIKALRPKYSILVRNDKYVMAKDNQYQYYFIVSKDNSFKLGPFRTVPQAYAAYHALLAPPKPVLHIDFKARKRLNPSNS